MFRFLIALLSAGLLILGLGSLTQATEGVGLVAGACVLGIYARIAQASRHRDQVLKALAEARTPANSSEPKHASTV